MNPDRPEKRRPEEPRPCRLCGGETALFLDLGLQWPSEPLWPEPVPPVPDRRHPLRLDACRLCGFVQIPDPLSPELIYPDAGLEMTSWKNLPQTGWQVDLLKRESPLDANLVEIGCNDGHFLAALRDAGFSRLAGIEPSRVSGPLARGKGFEVREGFATPAAAKELVEVRGKFDLAAAKHVFGHIPDLPGFFSCLDTLLTPKGKLFLEIPDFSVALAAADCSLIYEELVGHFTSDTLRFILAHFGYTILIEQKFPCNGGLIEILARRSPNPPHPPPFPAIPAALADFSGRARDYAGRLGDRLESFQSRGWPAFFFGAGMRSAALLNGFGLAPKITALLDDNPAKQGRYYPGCGLPILAPEAAAEKYGAGGKKLFLLAVSNENEEKVVQRIKRLFAGEVLCASVLGPGDREKELAGPRSGIDEEGH
ncbi:MAG: class I SAM-dependent methyltransferase [Planctomycetota bacterium]|jgi:SAM-dependent methyltransferase|nr:class I SAM-dependent methyltransferase [Planctomycetota bacterium]